MRTKNVTRYRGVQSACFPAGVTVKLVGDGVAIFLRGKCVKKWCEMFVKMQTGLNN